MACAQDRRAKRALVIGSRLAHPHQDRGTCVLFGTAPRGGGRIAQQPGTREDRGILAPICARTDATSKLYVDGGPSSTMTVGHLRMEGRAVSSTRWRW